VRRLLLPLVLAGPAMAHPDHGGLAARHRARATAGALPGGGRQWPAGDYSSLIIPFTPDKRDQLLSLESRFSKRDAWPRENHWDNLCFHANPIFIQRR
jgi:hypothetical protein